MSRWHPLVAIVGTLLFVSSLVGADGSTAQWLEPSENWYGIDGNWSTTRLLVGDPAQEIDVVVSTSISEVWVVENRECGTALCNNTHGGVFNISASNSWTPMGLWPLGLKFCGMNSNGDYGMETVMAYGNTGKPQIAFGKLIVAGINETAAYNGFFGLGISKGDFDTVAQGPIASLVEQRGIIPSYSYGYTAGAHYAGANGVPMSLTLGGYDANRFEPHDVQFSLSAATKQPQVLVRAITATVSTFADALTTEWSASSTLLTSFNESLTATIDSSTPYLWLPPAICDRFAGALNLTWNDTLALYLFSGPDSLERYRSAPDLSFTFTLSSLDNKDKNRLSPNMPGIVNITISANAFVQSLRYPYKNLIIRDASPIPYFPLKRAEDSNELIIGRSFLQEAYIITNYETSMFSIHEARFPTDPLSNTSIQTIAASRNRPYPGSPGRDRFGMMTHGQIVGVVIGACLGAIALVVIIVLVRRKRQVFKEDGDRVVYQEKYATSEPESSIRPTPMDLFRFKPRGKSNQSKKRGNHDLFETGAADVNRGLDYQRMSAPIPAEFDESTAGAYFASPVGDNIYGWGSYNPPQQWAQLPQTAGPDGFSSPTDGNHRVAYVPPLVNPRFCDYASPISSPTQEYDVNAMPSPITPTSDGPTYFGDYPSPIAGFFSPRTLSDTTPSPTTVVRIPPPSPVDANHSLAHARSMSSITSANSMPPISMPPPLIQRTPIDSTHVVCLGPLPENIQLPHQLMLHNPRNAQGNNIPLATMPIVSENHSRPQSIADTLGSNYTLEEEARIAATRANTTAPGRLDGNDIVQVPQMAHRRFSWEERR
ncbi:aspartic peptidase domain-containing protein [Xylaria nigripes]|nr:aspartic peptidase domain-containing protein [Xylaria nigripes]